MVQETRVTTRGDKELALYELETRFAMAVRQRELLENYIRERLHPDKHFYTVGDEPGRKPSLTKEGAELICLPHNLKGHYEWLFGSENPPMDDSPYQITMKCIFENNGKFEGEGVGSASSMITKRDGTRVQRQKDPGLRHNATIKMACKSAYIAATLNSTAASEFFTQDLEDDQTGESKKPEQKGHWCTEHKTVFFMKGKMKSYAHPIEGTDPVEWCHEHKEKLEAKKDTRGEFEKEGRDLVEEAPESKSEPLEEQTNGNGQEEESKAGYGKPPKDTSSIIDLDWLKESLETLKGKGLKAWSDKNLLLYMKTSYGVEAETPLEAAKKLDKGKAAHFTKKIQETLDLT